MSKPEKKMAAAIAAVNAYLREEEERALNQTPELEPQPTLNVWAHSGRQDMMNMRRMLQLRAFGRVH